MGCGVECGDVALGCVSGEVGGAEVFELFLCCGFAGGRKWDVEGEFEFFKCGKWVRFKIWNGVNSSEWGGMGFLFCNCEPVFVVGGEDGVGFFV